ncbi:MAG TPA: PhoH family protein [Aliidongia sp.]|uniref:PhoH family protein n=1 Tax=Aliidongia sp. TaxID=1914230 RepID=UPI002DDDAF75|nr:PhoH family protein [Aliidongia sp.]HEV2673967.1 PhoH family protein [Aliidongia sp.]
MSPAPDLPEQPSVQMAFDDNSLLAHLVGEHDQHLDRIERRLGVRLTARGNVMTIDGPASAVEQARIVLTTLYDRLRRGVELDQAEVDAVLRIVPARATEPRRPDAAPLPPPEPELAIRTRKRQITARSVTQRSYIQALRQNDLVFGLGPAGTGKTYLAVAAAVDMLMTGQVQRIILSRPAVEAGERLGFLPGDLKDKVDPYLRPLYDALHDMLPADQILKRLGNGDIEVAPLAFMRGRTLAHAFVILDEAQNTTAVQMKMFLTRLGEGSRMAVTGDLTQVDLPRGTQSGLKDALDTLEGVEGVATVRFGEDDVVRHPMVQRIVHAYNARDRQRTAARDAENPVVEPGPVP